MSRLSSYRHRRYAIIAAGALAAVIGYASAAVAGQCPADKFQPGVREAVTTPPPSLGYGFSVWSVARLNEYLKKRTGISFSEDQLRRILHQEGFSFQRPKHTMRGKRDEAAFTRAQKELQTLKKKHARTTPTSR